MQHVRGQPGQGTISGQVTGTFSLVNNFNVDPRTGRGDLFGSFTITIGQGTFSGHYSGTISGGHSSGTFVGQGSDQMKIMGTFQEMSPVADTLQGIILSPHG